MFKTQPKVELVVVAQKDIQDIMDHDKVEVTFKVEEKGPTEEFYK